MKLALLKKTKRSDQARKVVDEVHPTEDVNSGFQSGKDIGGDHPTDEEEKSWMKVISLKT